MSNPDVNLGAIIGLSVFIIGIVERLVKYGAKMEEMRLKIEENSKLELRVSSLESNDHGTELAIDRLTLRMDYVVLSVDEQKSSVKEIERMLRGRT